MNTYKLSPSDLTFLWQGCKRCFWMKVRHNKRQVSMPMVPMFTQIDGNMRAFYDGGSAEALLGLSKPGIIHCKKDIGVQSHVFQPPGSECSCYLNGKLDAFVEFEDGSFAVVDFKTAKPSEEKGLLYGRQLHAYAYGLEHPADGKPHKSPITHLGLVYFDPTSYVLAGGEASFTGKAEYREIPRDDVAFLAMISEMLSVLDQESPPPSGPTCDWCDYRDWGRRTGF